MPSPCKTAVLLVGVGRLDSGLLLVAGQPRHLSLSPVVDYVTSAIYLNSTVVQAAGDDAEERQAPAKAGGRFHPWQIATTIGAAPWCVAALAGGAICDVMITRVIRGVLPSVRLRRAARGSDASSDSAPSTEENASEGVAEWQSQDPGSLRFKAGVLLPFVLAGAACLRRLCRAGRGRSLRRQGGNYLVNLSSCPAENSESDGDTVTPSTGKDSEELDMHNIWGDSPSAVSFGNGMVRQRTSEIEKRIEFHRIMTDDTEMRRQVSARRSTSADSSWSGDLLSDESGSRSPPKYSTNRQRTEELPISREFEALSHYY
mmetsp:Transcript_43138/g.99948  ORF Transcript_43138/g.99948 Transcript_43138/m.99948 type:complete len:316 (+) Transcript_43138:88-1035(+)